MNQILKSIGKNCFGPKNEIDNEIDNAINEPAREAMEINFLWGKVWPKVIARVWKENYEGEWCKLLLSGKPEDVKKALLQIVTKKIGGEIDPKEVEGYEWFWDNLKIIIKKREEGVALSYKSSENVDVKYKDVSIPNSENSIYNYKENGENGWIEVKGIGHHLILTIPPKPAEDKDVACAITDYEAAGLVYPFTFCC